MSALSQTDAELYENYKKAKVLEDINTHKLDPKDGLSIVMCGDPDQHPEAYSYQVSDILKAGCSKRIHPPAPLGGALRLAPNSPANINTPGYDLALLSDLKLVHEKKDINTFALYVHAPCAIAAMSNMSFKDIIHYAFAAKALLKREMVGVKVAVFCHVDRGGLRKTYFISRCKWELYHSHPMQPITMMYPDRAVMSEHRPYA